MAIYTVSISGSNYICKNEGGTTIASNADFGALLNALQSLIPSGNTISILSGTYVLDTQVNWIVDHITFTLASDTRIEENASSASTLFRLYDGTPSTTDPHSITVNGGIWDGNSNPTRSPAWWIGGYGNIWQNATVLDAMQYDLHFWRAHSSKALYNTVTKGQYCISTGADPLVPHLQTMNTDLEIGYNIVKDPQDVGIKIRGVNVALVHHNDIDCAYVTWTTNRGGSTTEGAAGVRYYSLDAPCIDVVVDSNTIYDSRRGYRHTYGVMVDVDQTSGLWEPTGVKSSGHIITNNTITDCYDGILCKFDGVKIGIDASNNPAGNVIRTPVRYGINLWGDNCIVRFNDLRNCGSTPINDLGTGNTKNSNLFTSTASGRRKLTTSSNIATGITLQGFQLEQNEICYTETGGTIIVGGPTITGYVLDKIYVDGVGHNPVNGTYSFVVASKDYTISVTYVGDVPPPVSYTVNTAVVGNGNIAVYPVQSTYPDGSSIIVTATPDLHWLFSGWSGDATGSTNPVTLTVTGNMNITGTFEVDPVPTQHILKITIPKMVVEITVEQVS